MSEQQPKGNDMTTDAGAKGGEQTKKPSERIWPLRSSEDCRDYQRMVVRVLDEQHARITALESERATPTPQPAPGVEGDWAVEIEQLYRGFKIIAATIAHEQLIKRNLEAALRAAEKRGREQGEADHLQQMQRHAGEWTREVERLTAEVLRWTEHAAEYAQKAAAAQADAARCREVLDMADIALKAIEVPGSAAAIAISGIAALLHPKPGEAEAKPRGLPNTCTACGGRIGLDETWTSETIGCNCLSRRGLVASATLPW